MRGKILKGYICAVLSSVIYGCMPLMAKHIYADGVNPFTLVFLRNFLALPCLALLAFRECKSLKVSVKALPSIGLVSLFGCCITPVLLCSAYTYIPTGTATVFHFIHPSVVVLIGVLFLKKKVPVGTLVSVALCFAGICLFYDPAMPFDFRGGMLALLSGVTFAIYVVLLSCFKYSRISGFLFGFYVAAASSIAALAVCLVTGALSLPESLAGWGLCMLFALAITAGAVVLFQQGAFLIGGEKTAILSSLEPITSMVVGAVAFHEPVVLRVLIGSTFVVAASICITALDMRKKKDAQKAG